MAGAHLVGHGADAADARGDVGHLADLASAQQGLEEPGRFEDIQFHVLDPVSVELDVKRPSPSTRDRALTSKMRLAGMADHLVPGLVAWVSRPARIASLAAWARAPLASRNSGA